MYFVPLIYAIDKLLDEYMRITEFKKLFLHWFILGVMRNLWCYLTLAFLLLDYKIEEALNNSALITFLVFLSTFALVNYRFFSKIELVNPYKGYLTILLSAKYYSSSIYNALTRNFDKVLISLHPSEHSAYLIVFSMFLGSSFIIVDAFFISPRRKLISRYPVLFLRRINNIIRNKVKLNKVVLFFILFYFTLIFANIDLFVSIIMTLMLINTVIILQITINQEAIFWLLHKDDYFFIHSIQIAISVIIFIFFRMISNEPDFLNQLIPLLIPIISSLFYLAHIHFYFKSKSYDI